MHLNRRTPIYPLKVHRLEQLDDAGLNVTDFICFPPGELNERELRRFCSKFKAVSCRTFSADEDKEFKTPVKYEISVDTKPLQRVDARRFGSSQAREVEQLVDAVARFRYRPVIFEFSLYPYPVGKRKEHLVFWEWRKA